MKETELFVEIISDGTSIGTKVMDKDGNLIKGVQKVTWEVDIDSHYATVVLEVANVPVKVKGKDESNHI